MVEKDERKVPLPALSERKEKGGMPRSGIPCDEIVQKNLEREELVSGIAAPLELRVIAFGTHGAETKN